MSGLGFLAGLGLLGGAAASKMAAPQSLSKHYRTDVVESNSRVASIIYLDIVYPKSSSFYNEAEGCTRLAWERYLTKTEGYSGDFFTRSAYSAEQYTNSLFGYNLEQIYYDIAKNKQEFGLKEKETKRIFRDVVLKFVCSKMGLRFVADVQDNSSFEKLYDRYINSTKFLDPKFQKIQRVGKEIVDNKYNWSTKQKEAHIIESFPECLNTPREKLEYYEHLHTLSKTLEEWIPMESAENLNRLKAEIELVYGSTLQDTIHKIWMNGGEGTYLAPGNDPNRARRDGNSIFIHCSVHDYGKSSAHVTGFDFPPVNDYEREKYQRYAELKKEE